MFNVDPFVSRVTHFNPFFNERSVHKGEIISYAMCCTRDLGGGKKYKHPTTQDILIKNQFWLNYWYVCTKAVIFPPIPTYKWDHNWISTSMHQSGKYVVLGVLMWIDRTSETARVDIFLQWLLPSWVKLWQASPIVAFPRQTDKQCRLAETTVVKSALGGTADSVQPHAKKAIGCLLS